MFRSRSRTSVETTPKSPRISFENPFSKLNKKPHKNRSLTSLGEKEDSTQLEIFKLTFAAAMTVAYASREVFHAVKANK